MNLEELKKLREENIKRHKEKKRAYYLKRKLAKQQKEMPSKKPIYNYENELFGDNVNFSEKIKEIVSKQKKHVDDRHAVIVAKLEEYRKRKREYYEKNKEQRLAYDKEYREKQKEKIKQYRKEYYRKNREKILQKQKLSRDRKKSQLKNDGV